MGDATRGADSPRGMQLPPPDLSQAYAGLPHAWQIGAVLLADRVLAAAYMEDVRWVAQVVLKDAREGAGAPGRGKTVAEYLDDETAAHPRVVDRRRALDVLKYSPSVELPLPAEEDVPMPERARLLFRLDVAAALRGMATRGPAGPDGEGSGPLDLPDAYVRDPRLSVSERRWLDHPEDPR
jgi:hypothetical protein